MKSKTFKIDFSVYFLLVCISQFSSAVVLVLSDTHHQHDLNLVIGDHQVT